MDSRAEVRIAADPEALAREAGEWLILQIRRIVDSKGRCAVALSGGTTPEKLYRFWSEPEVSRRIPWDRVHFFWGDERHVPPQHADSNYRMVRQAWAQVPVPEVNLHRVPAEEPEAEEAARQYESTLREFFTEGLPRFDLMLLGLGPDGHTASLFPGGDAVFETERWVVAPYVPKLSTYRISLTVPVINASEQTVFLVAGSSKAPALKAVWSDPKDPLKLPAQAIEPKEGKLIWWLDRAAAQDLMPADREQGSAAKR